MTTNELQELKDLITEAISTEEDYDEPTDGLLLDIAHGIVHADAISDGSKLDMLGTLLLFSNDMRDNLQGVLKFFGGEE